MHIAPGMNPKLGELPRSARSAPASFRDCGHALPRVAALAAVPFRREPTALKVAWPGVPARTDGAWL